MSTRRLRQDVDHATSVLLLLSVVAATVTGVLAHVWDLNDFGWHTWSGYAMAGFAGLHVALNLDRLVTYWRFRSSQLSRRLRGSRPRGVGPVGVGPPGRTNLRPARTPRRRAGAITRRLMLTGAVSTVSALGGWAVARRVGTAADPVAGDAGMVYHRLSRPGVADAVDSVGDVG